MFIRDIFAQKKPVLSFEVFPPKKDSGLDNVISAVDELSKMPIDYMSVTYGAGGSNSKNTAYIASHLTNNLSIPSLAHLTLSLIHIFTPLFLRTCVIHIGNTITITKSIFCNFIYIFTHRYSG